MNPTERQWVWGSLAIVGGVGLVLATSKLSRPGAPSAVPGKVSDAPLLRAGDRVLLIGDSLAQGLAPPLAQLAKADSVVLTGRGRQSTTIGQWAVQSWLGQALAEGPFELVLISLGTNDMKLASPTSEAPAIQAILQTVQATGARMVWVAPPVMPFPDKGVRAMIGTAGAPVFPSDTLDIARAADGIHCTLAGYAGWSGAIWHWLSA